jgi:hypothetical protein
MECSRLRLDTDCTRNEDQPNSLLVSLSSTVHYELYDEEYESVSITLFCMIQLTKGRMAYTTIPQTPLSPKTATKASFLGAAPLTARAMIIRASTRSFSPCLHYPMVLPNSSTTTRQ